MQDAQNKKSPEKISEVWVVLLVAFLVTILGSIILMHFFGGPLIFAVGYAIMGGAN